MGVQAAEQISVRDAGGGVRGTQSFVRVMQWCWLHPAAVALEVLWRWVFGAVLVGVMWRWGVPALSGALGGPDGVARAMAQVEGLSLLEPTQTVVRVSALSGVVGPAIGQLVMRLGLPLAAIWVVCSTGGRWLVLRRVDRTKGGAWGSAAALQAIRLVMLAGFTGGWMALVRWAAMRELSTPVSAGQEPALVPFFAIAILGTLLFFVAWSLVSYLVSMPPLLALCRGLGVRASLLAGTATAGLRMKLIEINLVMGIVKVALLVVFLTVSACPLPFQSVITPEFLFWWTTGCAVLYCVASDFFHVARQVAMLRLWEVFREG